MAEPVPASWDELAESHPGGGTVWAGPQRVVDGLIASTLGRPVWSVAVDQLRGVGFLDELLALAHGHAKRCVAMPSHGAADGVEPVPAAAFDQLGPALGLPVALIAHVGVDPHDDGALALGAGIRPILLGTPPAARGTLVVATPAQLAALMRGEATTPATSTYHEV
ncbi:hypothetical protein [Allorhizocola rhizosphaerae]|uniref:hypothetical protein n=1 Tax=Allorhizocola rhizosphaerae TaxID=1872709 RepID=UPI000E3DA125|nr:hypothetical protein [Allorhizocola rhizosphaerae]